MSRKNNTSFIVELFILFALLITVITVITVTSVRTRSVSEKARTLTGAVICAENTAEMTAGSRTLQEAAGLIRQMEGASAVETGDGVIRFRITDTSGKGRGQSFDVTLRWEDEARGAGYYIEQTIDVCGQDDDETVYSLTGGHYIKASGEEAS